ncbi:MAG: 6-phosphogluconolactonase [Ferruginibacter sp.]
MQAKKNIVTTWPNAAALALSAANLIVIESNKAIVTKGYFTIALSGGSTPKLLFELLATAPFAKNIQWKKVFVFFGDERFVPHTSAESNYKMAFDTLLSKVGIPPKNIFGIKTADTSPAQSATYYEQAVKKYVDARRPFDMILLGIGEEGHTASIFPGSALLGEKKKLVKEVFVKEKDMWRISFTLPLINRAKNVAFLVSGDGKKDILKTIFSAKGKKLPAAMVQPAGNLCWFIDEAAAASL